MITIPVIDISPFTENGPGAEAVVHAVRAACEEHGFFVVAGHGIPPEVNEDLDRTCRAFFSRPQQEKSAFTPESGERKRGWWGVGAMATARSLGLESPPDFMEYLSFGPDVPVVPDTYVINIGDLMARWSNHRWRSSMHRVVCPADTSIDRLSVPLLFNPSLDAQVQCVPTCLAPGEPPADAVTSGEWIARKTYATT